ncbi:class I SAM-dependent methyltransferase [Christiangramia echinicola]|uniref:Methyltransferase domain-containing protein n=1 Tax=Christiangramia echinicola TaxID=279359 RepID=A0A1H1L4N1_9FLAO|nr:class I SAM-dependent methyltransferase [Christiangramia echinicola]SDR69232.1 Methyltransferase domain-containing protein [Christiangramia echinicola]
MDLIPKEYYRELEKEIIECPTCATTSFSVLCTKDRYSMDIQSVICKKCSLIYLNPRPTEVEMNNFYENHYRQLYESIKTPTKEYINEGPFIPRANFVLEKIKPYLNKAKSYLDIGCAEGTLIAKVENEHPNVKTFGLEPDKNFGNYAKENSKAEIFLGGYKSFLKEKRESNFDVITCTHVLEHILFPKEFLKGISCLMTQNSIFYIEVPNILDNRVKGVGSVHLGHVMSFDPESLEILLKLSGFEIVEFYEKGLPAKTPSMAIICRLARREQDVKLPSDEKINQKGKLFSTRVCEGKSVRNSKYNFLDILRKKLFVST